MTLTAPRTIAGQVAERLKAEILAGERVAGTRLRQVEIAERFGVSTTPVREALATLQREGLVRLHPQRGAHSNSRSVVQYGQASSGRRWLGYRFVRKRAGAAMYKAKYGTTSRVISMRRLNRTV